MTIQFHVYSVCGIRGDQPDWKGTSREDIAYGVVESVAVKVAQLISQLDGTNYFLTGDFVRMNI